jgi:hypothetical protein
MWGREKAAGHITAERGEVRPKDGNGEMVRMNWRRAALQSKPSLDFRYEHDVPDRAAKWLRAVERRRRERRYIAPISSWSSASTVAGSTEVPW